MSIWEFITNSKKKASSKQTWFFVKFELDFYCLCSLQKSISKSNGFFNFFNLIFRNWKKIEWHSIFKKSSGDRQGVRILTWFELDATLEILLFFFPFGPFLCITWLNFLKFWLPCPATYSLSFSIWSKLVTSVPPAGVYIWRNGPIEGCRVVVRSVFRFSMFLVCLNLTC